MPNFIFQIGHRTRYLALALGLSGLAVASANAAIVPIYKCVQENGATLYTDLPCTNGTILDIRPGTPDPSAVERLAAARAELAEDAARRRSNDELAAALRAGSGFAPYELQSNVPAYSDPVYSNASYGLIYVPTYFHRRRYPRNGFKRVDHHRFGFDHATSVESRYRGRGAPARVAVGR